MKEQFRTLADLWVIFLESLVTLITLHVGSSCFCYIKDCIKL